MLQRRIFLAVVFVCLAVFAYIGSVADARAEIELGEVLVVTAEVVGIDRVDRTLALLGPEGNVLVVEIGYEARNFDEIEVGDQVKVEYYQSVALYITKDRNEGPGETAGHITARSAAGEKPAGIVVETVDLSAMVYSFDRGRRTVKLERHDGSKFDVYVDESFEIYNQLRKGDIIHLRHTEAIAVTVRSM